MKKIILCAVLILFAALTYASKIGGPSELLPLRNNFKKLSIRDRLGAPMLISYGENLNYHNYLRISDIPPFLAKSFVYLEDKRFFDHKGVDWRAKFSAVFQNIRNFKIVRGASTISEQVVRILRPRKRTLWSRWLEGFEAEDLESKFKKEEILEFYLNQVPYAANRRGVEQAAYTYFNRDLDTLNELEMLCLAYLIRSPARLDPFKNEKKLSLRLKEISKSMRSGGVISQSEFESINKADLRTEPFKFKSDTGHFIEYVESQRNNIPGLVSPHGKLISTIDTQLQSKMKVLLNQRILELKEKNVRNGAILILDNNTNEILSWVNAETSGDAVDAGHIDAVRALRQPGSALKPFLYALALEKGWNAATILNDSPLMQAVGNGMHTYRNYSRIHYGDVRLREALGNSLNIPAIHAISYLGVGEFHHFLHKLGFTSLERPASFYGEGLALGNGEVSLLELVKAYAILAKGGVKEDFSFIMNQKKPASKRVISKESAEIISDILSDKDARRFEFGRYGVFNFPMETAVKTGTSTDFHDVWALGYTKHFTAGIWMGNLNRQAMIDVSGASGPGILLRSIFNELYKNREYEPLFRDAGLKKLQICSLSGKPPGPSCPLTDEIFDPKHSPAEICAENHSHGSNLAELENKPSIMFPTPGLQIAMDPRVPDESEAIRFKLKDQRNADKIEWVLNGSTFEKPVWRLQRGSHTLIARRFDESGMKVSTSKPVNFYVK